MADILLQAMEAKQNGNLALAKQLLAQALVQDPRNEGAWMMMSELVDEVKLKRNCLQRVLLINPKNEAASNALMKLDTSPLAPVMRGERYKPVIPPPAEKTPPFTPPFTWSGEEGQFQALGELTYPNAPAEETNQPPETPPTFDWAKESSEPDKTIDKIFEAVSNPEAASQPLPDTDLSWAEHAQTPEGQPMEGSGAVEMTATMPEGQGAPDVTPASPQEPQPVNMEDFRVSAEPELGMEAFTTPQEQGEPEEPASFLWDNPNAKYDRLIILGFTSIIYANPDASDIPHIVGLFNENKMVRDLLGKDAGMIKLDTIKSLTAIPTRTNLDVEYKPKDKSVTHQLIFKDRQSRDEALNAIKLRLGAGFYTKTRSMSGMRRYGWPVIIILVLAVLGYGLTGGLQLLSTLPFFKSGWPELIVYNLQWYVNQLGSFYVLMIALIGVLLCLIWLVSNLSKPAKLIIVERK